MVLQYANSKGYAFKRNASAPLTYQVFYLRDDCSFQVPWMTQLSKCVCVLVVIVLCVCVCVGGGGGALLH